jgi:hypothetical protein
MGCSACLDFGICGGLHLEGGFWDCSELCCGSPKSCTGRMCRFNMADYARRHAEVGGFELDRIARATHNPIEPLPVVVPMVYHGKRRQRAFAAPVVAVRLRDLYFKKSGVPRFASRAALLEHFRIAETARIIVTGIDNDAAVERWWGLSERRAAIIHNLKHDLGIDLVTVPNFSLAVSWPRWCDLYSMKRIGLSWEELSNAGMATALHPNGRTESDFERWQRVIATRPEVRHLSFEFTTGAGGPGLREKYAARLVALARAAPDAPDRNGWAGDVADARVRVRDADGDRDIDIHEDAARPTRDLMPGLSYDRDGVQAQNSREGYRMWSNPAAAHARTMRSLTSAAT